MSNDLDMSSQVPIDIPTVSAAIEQTDNVECTPEETQNRLATCIACENFYIDEEIHTKCQATGCNISFMTTLNFKSCPKGSW
jgi:hypothetical protein